VRFTYRAAWAFLIRFLCPAAVVGIIVYIVTTGNYF
jgi:hypothetical protein